MPNYQINMHIIAKINFLRKGLLLYRSIRYRKGFGVHSPFVFSLITKVIEEKCPYYCFQEIELLRKQLLFGEKKITYPDRKCNGRIKTRAIGSIVKHEAISPKEGALLFRLTNYFKSKHILQIGSNMGLSTLYLTSYAKGLSCIALEHIPEFAEISKQTISRKGRNKVDLRIGEYIKLLPQALNDLHTVDLVFFNTQHETVDNQELFNECLKFVKNETLFIFEGINANNEMRSFWKNVCACPEVTVSLDLFSLGIAVFNKKLHKKNYIVYF